MPCVECEAKTKTGGDSLQISCSQCDTEQHHFLHQIEEMVGGATSVGYEFAQNGLSVGIMVAGRMPDFPRE
jgi:hypothetical protein